MPTMMPSKVAALCALLAASATAQPDSTPCDNNGAYDTSGGTAICGGFNVDIKALVCGDGFSQASCVAQWVNGGERELYYFMGAGTGMDVGMLPAACSGLPSGLAMVQYKPDGSAECYPAADLAGSTMAYTAGSSSTPASITLNFAEHDDGSNTRNGYIKVTCSATEGGFTTIGDSNQASFYEVDVSATCAGAPAPSGGKGGKGGSGGSGGSGGVIFILIVLVGSSVYFAGGFIFNWKVKHLEGRERIPHVDFWTGLPGLVKEGVRFLKAKVTRTDYTPI